MLSDDEDFQLSDLAFNKEKLAQLRTDPTTKVLKKLGTTLVFCHSGNESAGFYWVYNVEEEILTFFQEYSTVQLPGLNAVTQTAVWRSDLYNRDLPAGWTSHLVFDILLKSHKAIVSDSIHTRDGKRLWIRLIDQAISKGLYVRLYDTKLKSYRDINTPAEYRLWVTDGGAWGYNSVARMDLRFVIRKSI